ncbi:toxin [Pseudomonas synxantha]|uniref:SpvB/TcaC N-terminal domain-containing protein n=1 Tax=Pseudomonas synxantha TaxID=47883 RepID=UPI00078C429C|nr:SpvB/TcaC N-terminal domain-containing protein [Pseudomonas synxantha]AMS22947.1 toxin [Pseudomonas synxantha]
MSNPANESPLKVPSLPNAGTVIEGVAKGWGNVSTDGTATFEVALPISTGRGYAPTLSLTYQSTAGNSAFGFGWDVKPGAVTRRTQQGVPHYTAADTFQGPDAQHWMPERTTEGTLVQTQRDHFDQVPLGRRYLVTRYFPRVERRFERIEHWHSDGDAAGFWLIQAADGSRHVYGKTYAARIADPDNLSHVAQWLLEESLNAHGEHIGYQYLAETATDTGTAPHDCRAQRYLHKVCYGNVKAREKETLYLLKSDDLSSQAWHFYLLFDYGQRTTASDALPSYEALTPWLSREDAFSNFIFGFELRTLRLCRQILMFHVFADEPDMGPSPILVRRLRLEHHTFRNGLNTLLAVYEQAVDAQGTLTSLPPQEYLYQSSGLKLDTRRYQRFVDVPSLNDGQRYQLVDLYGEGVPGILYRGDQAWYYRAPQRAEASTGDQVAYAAPQELPAIAVADRSRPVYQALLDINGDGRLEWVLARPGMSGFFSLAPQRKEAGFVRFDAFPVEFLHPHAIFADLMGSGLADLTLVGPRSVRLYANRQSGFGQGVEQAHRVDGDDLPSFTRSSADWVGFSDILGSGQQHLVRIRHNEIKCWPNLGHGRFAKGRVLAALPFRETTFNAANVLLADLDGCGASDLLYLTTDEVRIFTNKGGNGFATTPLVLPWPSGVQYDSLCQVNVADLQGNGYASLVISVTHPHPRHWRYDFFDRKPCLLSGTNNNLGAQVEVRYRSSAQEWLDEKKQYQSEDKPAVSQLPFALNLIKHQEWRDEISHQRLTQRFSYRQAYYDADERAFQGFGLLLQTDEETRNSEVPVAGSQTKRWFHTGQALDMPQDHYSRHDADATKLGPTLLAIHDAPEQPQPTDHHDSLIASPTPPQVRAAAYALRGLPVRVEVFDLDSAKRTPSSVQQYRYLVRRLPQAGSDPTPRMLPLTLESVHYQYEQVPDDPVCEHQVNLRWDAYGSLVHNVTVHGARRKAARDAPPALLKDEHQQQWWRDTHDPAQQVFYLSETLAQWIHLSNDDQWRLGLPYRRRDNAWTLPNGQPPAGLNTTAINYETLINRLSGPLGPRAPRELSGLSIQYYREPGGKGLTLAPGTATFQGLADYQETAELAPEALQALENIPDMPGQPAEDLPSRLRRIGYRPMAVFFHANDQERQAPSLWSIRRQFPRYFNAKHFYRLRTWRLTLAENETTLTYDAYGLQVIQVKQPDGCITRVQHDYRLLQPISITDPNGTTEQALYDGFGRLIATSIHGQESGKSIGFGQLSAYRRPLDTPIELAIQTPATLLREAAKAWLYDAFSWMGSIATADRQADWVTQRYLLPDGHIRATARLRLKKKASTLSASEKALADLIQKIRREPARSLMLAADRYTDDQEQLIHMTLVAQDGFGRILQSKQKAEPGPAYAVDDKGDLRVENGALQTVQADPRWCVYEHTEYSPRGLIIRVYRTYYAEHHRHIDGNPLLHSDTQFHDALGRPVRTLTARGGMRQTTYWAWYTVSEDENDTWEPPPAGQTSKP